MTQLIAYHGKQSEKSDILKVLRAHRKADEIEKGHYWDGGKGCAVGCTIKGNDHSLYESWEHWTDAKAIASTALDPQFKGGGNG